MYPIPGELKVALGMVVAAVEGVRAHGTVDLDLVEEAINQLVCARRRENTEQKNWETA